MALLVRTLLTSRAAAGSVQKLAFRGIPLIKWRRSVKADGAGSEAVEIRFRGKQRSDILFDLSLSFTAEERTLHTVLVDRPHSKPGAPYEDYSSLLGLCKSTISLATKVQTLRIDSDFPRLPNIRHALRATADSGSMQSITTYNLCQDVIHGSGRREHAVLDWDNALCIPFLTPATTSA